MTLLNEVDKPGSDVEVYARGLDKILLKKIQIITGLRERLLNFYSHLKTEEHMSRLYERNQELAQDSSNADMNTQDNSNFKSVTQQASSGNLVDDILSGVYKDDNLNEEGLLDGDLEQLKDDEDLLN